jgi:glyoxylate reductase
MLHKILVTGPVHEKGINLLKKHFLIEGNLERIMNRSEVLEAIVDKVGLVVASALKVDRELLEYAPNLRVISTVSVGFDHIDIEEATRRGIYVCNTPGVLTDCVAEMTWGLILSTYKRIVEAERFVRAKMWTRDLYDTEFLGRDLKGKILGIVGMGRIGRRVAEIAKCFDMRVIYYDVVRLPDAERLGYKYCDLDTLMSEADVVSIHVPLNKETYHLIDEQKINRMKKDAILINTARGKIVDEKALIRALKEKRIAGAGLDVFEIEPLPSDSELLELENVVLSPHRGSASIETRSVMAELAAKNLIAVLKGQIPPALVNPQVMVIRPLEKVKLL